MYLTSIVNKLTSLEKTSIKISAEYNNIIKEIVWFIIERSLKRTTALFV